MTSRFTPRSLAYSLIYLFLLISCTKDESTPGGTGNPGGGGGSAKTTPFVGLALVTSVKGDSVTFSGEVLSDGQSEVAVRGFCWSRSANPTIADSTISKNGTGVGKFLHTTAITRGVLYHVRAYATNSVGTTYGEPATFQSNIGAPEFSTMAVSNITANTAVSGATINSDGGTHIVQRGICWSTTPNPSVAHSKTSNGPGKGMFSATMTGLIPSTTYYVRSYVSYSADLTNIAYGDILTFTTPARIPTVKTSPVSPIISRSAVSGGTTGPQSGTIIERGLCWSLTSEPTVSDDKTKLGPGSGTFRSTMKNLGPNNTYYVRAYATTAAGTGYGEEFKFKTTPLAVDIEGNEYQTVVIGTQTWMVENLRTKTYSNGMAITTSSTPTVNMELAIFPLFQWAYGGVADNAPVYGLLYTWNVVKDAAQLAPKGWHIPSKEEWTTLHQFVGSDAGDALKEEGNAHWTVNYGTIGGAYARNTSGFTALPGGFRTAKAFEELKSQGRWWSRSTADQGKTGISYWLYGGRHDLISFEMEPLYHGLSVRCIKD